MLDGTAEGSAKVIAVVRILYQRPGDRVWCGVPVERVEIGIAVELKQLAVKVVGS